MKKTLSAVILISALSLTAAPANATTDLPPGCTVIIETVTVPEVPATYETVVIPAVTTTEYEFAQRNSEQHENNGHGATTRWEGDPNWNAQGNPNSQGWTATGNTREVEVTPETTEQRLLNPAIPSREETMERVDCVPVPETPIPPHGEPAPPEPTDEAYPAPPVVTNTVNGSPVGSAPAAAAAIATTETETVVTEGAQLANTGAEEGLILWGLAGLLALIAGITSVVLARRKA